MLMLLLLQLIEAKTPGTTADDLQQQLRKKLDVVFNKLDSDGDGQVSISEFKKLLVPKFLAEKEAQILFDFIDGYDFDGKNTNMVDGAIVQKELLAALMHVRFPDLDPKKRAAAEPAGEGDWD